jgi:hypothetical protein
MYIIGNANYKCVSANHVQISYAAGLLFIRTSLTLQESKYRHFGLGDVLVATIHVLEATILFDAGPKRLAVLAGSWVLGATFDTTIFALTAVNVGARPERYLDRFTLLESGIVLLVQLLIIGICLLKSRHGRMKKKDEEARPLLRSMAGSTAESYGSGQRGERRDDVNVRTIDDEDSDWHWKLFVLVRSAFSSEGESKLIEPDTSATCCYCEDSQDLEDSFLLSKFDFCLME